MTAPSTETACDAGVPRADVLKDSANHDPGDEDRRPIFRDWLDLFAWTADNGRHFPKLVPTLIEEYEQMRKEER